mgnify:CR=1 FL=1
MEIRYIRYGNSKYCWGALKTILNEFSRDMDAALAKSEKFLSKPDQAKTIKGRIIYFSHYRIYLFFYLFLLFFFYLSIYLHAVYFSFFLLSSFSFFRFRFVDGGAVGGAPRCRRCDRALCARKGGHCLVGFVSGAHRCRYGGRTLDGPKQHAGCAHRVRACVRPEVHVLRKYRSHSRALGDPSGQYPVFGCHSPLPGSVRGHCGLPVAHQLSSGFRSSRAQGPAGNQPRHPRYYNSDYFSLFVWLFCRPRGWAPASHKLAGTVSKNKPHLSAFHPCAGAVLGIPTQEACLERSIRAAATVLPNSPAGKFRSVF